MPFNDISRGSPTTTRSSWPPVFGWDSLPLIFPASRRISTSAIRLRRHHNWTTRSSNAGVNLYSVLIVVHKDRELITLLAIRSLRFSKHMVRRSRSSPFGGPSRRKVRVIAVLGSNCNNLGLLKRKPPTWPPDLHQQNGRSPNRPLFYVPTKAHDLDEAQGLTERCSGAKEQLPT